MKDDSSDGAVVVHGTWHRHPDYGTSPAFANDIALIELDTPVTLSDRVKVINMPKKDSTPAADTKMLMSGWGITKRKLLETNVNKHVYACNRGPPSVLRLFELVIFLAKAPVGFVHVSNC